MTLLPPRFGNFEDTVSFVSLAAVALGDVILMGTTVGIAMGIAAAAGTTIPVRIIGLVNNLNTDTTNPWVVGQAVYYDSANAVFTATPTPYRAGIGAAIKLAADSTASVILYPLAGSSANYIMNAATATLTNPSAETLFAAPGQYSIPANSLVVGSALTIEAWGQVTGQNSTNTHRFRAYLGGLAGLLLADTAAVAAAAATPFYIRARAIIRGVGATAGITIQAVTAFGVGGTGPELIGTPLVSTIDTTVAQLVGVSGLCSASSSGNTSRLDGFSVARS